MSFEPQYPSETSVQSMDAALFSKRNDSLRRATEASGDQKH
jgi:hypothetical protein